MQPQGGFVVWKPSTEDIQCPRDALHHTEGLSCWNWKGVNWWRQVTQLEGNQEKEPFRTLYHIEHGGPKDASAFKEAIAQTTTFKMCDFHTFHLCAAKSQGYSKSVLDDFFSWSFSAQSVWSRHPDASPIDFHTKHWDSAMVASHLCSHFQPLQSSMEELTQLSSWWKRAPGVLKLRFSMGGWVEFWKLLFFKVPFKLKNYFTSFYMQNGF